MNGKKFSISPYQLLILVFTCLIIVGTVLLKLPFATNKPISWVDALFTATSASTVTGLAVFDTAETYTLFGEIVVISLIQLGGLGIMSFAILIYIMLGKKIGFKERLLMQQALNQNSIGGVIKLVRNLFIISFLVEFIAMIFLSIRWVPEYGWAKGFYLSFFHSISAFNNAGFALWSDGLMGYVGDPLINVVISLLFIIGGIGFTVLADIWQKKSFKKLSLHTKIMIIGTIVINFVAMFLIFTLEYHNPKTLAGLPTLADKLWASYFQATSPRTAGFNTLDIGSLDESTIFLMLLLMFVGAGSGSTGGGIKLTTFLVIILSVFTFLKGKRDIVITKRTIDDSFVFRSLSIATIALLFIFVAVFILNITEDAPFLALLFEVISAFGTVGLSMGLTFSLTTIGKIVIIFIMFLGKLGPLTLALSLSKPEIARMKYPNEDILTG
ncbi:TrkH family potassium uptake protein [Gottfriedia solisilvae]|uniref:Ktr system potassium transporter B n=1 Tax=Gottfriedia solisilvae TaxID=1516104 RepID=A0A8J3AJP1_9BACI|nr:TrkH family potassium uptake protein [Gottfriedia solisilvae]GGI15807.1 Ktr system potassium transporter B [Gottfriedia solisilvae]